MRKLIIKKFLTLYNRDSGEFIMSEHLWYRWYGINSKFYQKLWNKLGGAEDKYLFDDFCDISFDVKNNNFQWMFTLPHRRMNKLFLFSMGMLSHYLIVTVIWKVIEFMIRIAYKLLSHFRHCENTLL